MSGALRRLRNVAVGLVCGLWLLCPVPVAAQAATGAGEFSALQARLVWKAGARSVPVSLDVGSLAGARVPLCGASIESSPGRAEALGAFADVTGVLAGVLPVVTELASLTPARANDPGTGEGSRSGEAVPLGSLGPRAGARTPSRTEAASAVTLGVGPVGLLDLSQGVATCSTLLDRAGTLFGDAVAEVHGLALGQIEVGEFVSRVRVEHRSDAEALVSYRMTLAGVEISGRPLLELGDGGVVLVGERIAAGSLLEHFNRQLSRYGRALARLAGEGSGISLALLAPQVERSPGGEVTVASPVLEAAVGVGALEVGVRLGLAEVRSFLAPAGTSLPGGPTGGSPSSPEPSGSAGTSSPGGPPGGSPSSVGPRRSRPGPGALREPVGGGRREDGNAVATGAPGSVPGELDDPGPGPLPVDVPGRPEDASFRDLLGLAGRAAGRARGDQSPPARPGFPPRAVHHGFLASVAVAMALLVTRAAFSANKRAQRRRARGSDSSQP